MAGDVRATAAFTPSVTLGWPKVKPGDVDIARNILDRYGFKTSIRVYTHGKQLRLSGKFPLDEQRAVAYLKAKAEIADRTNLVAYELFEPGENSLTIRVI